MTRTECIEALAQDLTEAASLEVLVDYYFEGMEKWLKSLNDEELVNEYDEWFEPDARIVITKDIQDDPQS